MKTVFLKGFTSEQCYIQFPVKCVFYDFDKGFCFLFGIKLNERNFMITA